MADIFQIMILFIGNNKITSLTHTHTHHRSR
jgi:hypothetical protein